MKKAPGRFKERIGKSKCCGVTEVRPSPAWHWAGCSQGEQHGRDEGWGLQGKEDPMPGKRDFPHISSPGVM